MILAIIVCVIIMTVGAIDWAALHKNQPRALAAELIGFAVVFVLALWPGILTHLASKVGIGRGVDLIIYPMLIWLFREAVLGRVRYYRQQEQMTVLIRRLAQRDVVMDGSDDRGPHI